jgi:hypothetical protein
MPWRLARCASRVGLWRHAAPSDFHVTREPPLRLQHQRRHIDIAGVSFCSIALHFLFPSSPVLIAPLIRLRLSHVQPQQPYRVDTSVCPTSLPSGASSSRAGDSSLFLGFPALRGNFSHCSAEGTPPTQARGPLPHFAELWLPLRPPIFPQTSETSHPTKSPHHSISNITLPSPISSTRQPRLPPRTPRPR